MKENSVDLICSISELISLFEKDTSINEFLQTVAEIIAKHMKASVCSVYIYNDQENKLVMEATYGLEQFAVGKISLQPGEGITGQAFKEERAIREAAGSENPNFKYVAGIMEETYDAFLAVPIISCHSKIGVLVVQDTEHDYFDENDSKVLRAIATQLATTIENAKLLMTLGPKKKDPEEQVYKEKIADLHFLKGEAASTGIAMGKALVFGNVNNDILLAESYISKQPTLRDFEDALKETEEQLMELQKQVARKLSDVASLIFSAHLLILKDTEFSGSMRELIEEGERPQQAIITVVNKYINLFQNHPNQRFKEKVHDMKDLGQRLLHNLFDHDEGNASFEGRIIIDDEVLPSDILKFAAQKAEGLVILGGTVTAHISILARSLELPTVLLKEEALLHLDPETYIIIDANQGNAYINPREDILEEYRKHKETLAQLTADGASIEEKTFTKDGRQINLFTNVNLLSDLKVATTMKAEGIGLYRSEFPFIVRNEFPSEEEQYKIYKQIVDGMKGREVTIRTLDIGGDKMLSFYPHIDESNPFLGMRAIRFSLKNRDIFATQIKAILRAAAGTQIKIMFPLISSVDDFLNAKEIVRECRKELKEDKVPYCKKPELGAMIELPSAVAIIEELAQEADFFSIGSNDLVQYMLAVDRTNSHISDLYQPHHPAVLRSLQKIVQTAEKAQIPVSLCGDIASDETLLPFLLGIGLTKLSLDPRLIPQVQRFIKTINIQEARKLADKILTKGKITDIEKLLKIKRK